MILNPYIQYFLFNFILLGLYVGKLSLLYHPKFEFVIYFLSILLFFLLLSTKFIFNCSLTEKEINNCFNIKKEREFINIVYCFFFIGIISNIWQMINYDIVLFEDNKVNKQFGDHYIQYLVNLLLISSSMAYIAMRENLKNKKKIMGMIFFFSNLNLLIWLNRGAFTLQLVTVLVYEYMKAKQKDKIKKFVLKFFVLGILFLGYFAYIGNIRNEYVIENIFKYTINEHYKMPDGYPNEFVWIYIYLTSPLENMSRIIENQFPYYHTMGMRMFYPFVAPAFKMIFDAPTTLKPPLDNEAGLNVSTYMVDAVTDFGFIGPYIYMVYLLFILRLGQISLRKGLYGILTYASVLNIAFWLSFSNSFAIGPFMIAFLFFLCITWIKDIKI